jgi:glycosyltransferase involved in cell wall biosynthesis
LKLILDVAAIAPPLTGIGRYTWELAAHYQRATQELDSVRFFKTGRWVHQPGELLTPLSPESISSKRKRRFLKPPQSWRRWRMQREMRGHVFHGPNYFLPESVEGGVVTVHDLSVFKYPETHPAARVRHFEQGFASTLARAAHLVTDSEATRREVIDYFGWSPQRITAIKLGVRSEFHARKPAELDVVLRERNLLAGGYSLCVSTLEPRKRIDRLLAAYHDLEPALRSRYPLVLAGSSGWLSADLQEQIRQGEREGWLRYLGFVDDVFLTSLYAGARAFLFPSIYEGFGLPVLEAMASGVPTLTSNTSSLPEVADGAALLVEPDDHHALLRGIETVLCDDDWREGAIRQGLQVASNATWEQCASKTLDLCRRFA